MRPHTLVIALMLAPALAAADDRWELSSFMIDDNNQTHNELRPGEVQRGHDFQGPDQDWYTFRTMARHSYEAVVGSGTVIWNPGTCNGCARFDRVDFGGAILTAGLADGSSHTFQPVSLAVRFIASASGTAYLRALGQANFNATDTYDIRLHDTTLFLPRFNNSASQVTVLIVQNTTDVAVSAEAYFYAADGSLLHTLPLNLPAQGTMVLNTSTIGALAGQSGSASVAHTGPYGALAGKGVALEPATGFTFDSVLAAVPR